MISMNAAQLQGSIPQVHCIIGMANLIALKVGGRLVDAIRDIRGKVSDLDGCRAHHATVCRRVVQSDPFPLESLAGESRATDDSSVLAKRLGIAGDRVTKSRRARPWLSFNAP